jgi:50S ribosomal subunit-associated GTPase HflX
MEPGLIGVLQGADAAWLVVDLSDPACTEQVVAIREELARRKIVLEESWPAPEGDDVFQVRLPTLLVANKSDLDPDPEEVKGLEELLQIRSRASCTRTSLQR